MSTAISDQDEALMHFLYQSPVGLVQASLGGDISMMNPMAAQLLIPLAKSGDATNLFDLLDACAPQLKGMVAAFGEGRGVICDSLRISSARVQHETRAPRVLAVSLLKLGDSGLMLSVSDVTTEVQREQDTLASQLHKAARIDILTELPNRAAVLETIEALKSAAALGGGPPFALLSINCDRFSHFNDTYGRGTGDALLKLLAARLTRAVRQGDIIVGNGTHDCVPAHLGGDDFVIVLPGIQRDEDAVQVTTRLQEILGEVYWIDGKPFHMTVSIGVVSPELIAADGDAQGLLQDADLAMDSAKRAGRGCFARFEPMMRVRAAHRGRLEEGLRHAIAEGELFVVYQPVMDLRQQGVAGLEALVRWRHPEHGLIHPEDFIGIAEETNLICDLGSFVLEEACRSFRAWQALLGEGAPRKVSVNLSRAQLLEPGIVEKFQAILVLTRVNPANLMLEITESLAVMDERIQKRLKQLKELGVVLALDDFGTGYSSLSSLHLLPVDVLKIDRSFVSLIEQSPHHQVLVEATVRVARSLGMRTIAEGIETEGQLKLLTSLGCDEAQGYLFSRPLPGDAIGEWLQREFDSRHSAA